MEINATLFMQILNFLLAYIIVDRIVIRLAISIIHTEDRKLGTLEAEVADHEKNIAGRLRYNEDDWIILQKRLQSECPKTTVGQHLQILYESPSPASPPSQERIKQIAEPLTCSLVNNILNLKDVHG